MSRKVKDEFLHPAYRDDASSGEESPIDPFQAGSGSGSEDTTSEEEDEPAPAPKKSRSLPLKARTTLNVDSDNPWRTSTIIGNLGGVRTPEHEKPEDTRGVPPKAQKTLGISGGGTINENSPRYTRLPAKTQAVPPKAQRTLGIPSNPFQKSVPQSEKDYFDDNDDERPDLSRSSSVLSGRTTLDVDAFTRLLLTGEKGSSAASTPSINYLPFQGVQADTSSNTDASSLSRQSILESQTGSHVETPRTSHESSPSLDELHKTIGKASSMYDAASPRNPYASGQSGRTISSFAVEFASSVPPVELSAETLYTPSKQTTSIAPMPSTDLNKPLPPPPLSASPESGAVSSMSPFPSSTEHASGPYELPAPRPRIAPMPPLARGQSQLRLKYPGTTSGNPAPIAEEHSDHAPTQASAPQAPVKAPAPPPPRRRGTDRNSVSLDIPNLPELGSASPKSSPKAEKQPPPLPPARTSSVSKRPEKELFPPSTSGSMAPPPPPRRRGSSSSGYSLRRPSGEIDQLDGEAPVLASSFAKEPATLQSSADVISKAAAGKRDIMADLSRLQREVDALRGKYERKGSSDQTGEPA